MLKKKKRENFFFVRRFRLNSLEDMGNVGELFILENE